MKAVVWHGNEDVRVGHVPDPKLEEPTDAIIRVNSTGSVDQVRLQGKGAALFGYSSALTNSRRTSYAALMKLMVPLVSSTHHLTSSSRSIPWPRASSATSSMFKRSERRFL